MNLKQFLLLLLGVIGAVILPFAVLFVIALLALPETSAQADVRDAFCNSVIIEARARGIDLDGVLTAGGDGGSGCIYVYIYDSISVEDKRTVEEIIEKKSKEMKIAVKYERTSWLRRMFEFLSNNSEVQATSQGKTGD